MRNAYVKRLSRGSGEGAAALVHNGAGNHHRDACEFTALKHGLDGKEGGFGIECVEDRLNKEKVHAWGSRVLQRQMK